MVSERTANTEWPSTPIPQAVKELIDHAFTLLDQRMGDSGQRLADEVFTPDAIFVHPFHTFHGSEEIAKSRSENVWKDFESRLHVCHKVFVASEKADDIMIHGTLHAGLMNGKTVKTDFAVRHKITDVDSQRPRLKFMQGISDSGSIMKEIA